MAGVESEVGARLRTTGSAPDQLALWMVEASTPAAEAPVEQFLIILWLCYVRAVGISAISRQMSQAPLALARLPWLHPRPSSKIRGYSRR